MKTKPQNKIKVAFLGLLAALFAAPAAMAQTTNQGVQNIVTAIDGLKPDVTTIVISGIGLGIIVLGAMVAWRVAKRFLG